MNKWRYVIFAFMLAFTGECFGVRYTLNGYVRDADSGEPLIGAAVFDTIGGSGAVTNTAGFFTLTFRSKADIAVRASYVGYIQSQTIRIPAEQMQSDSLIVFRLKEATRLREVEVVAARSVSSPEAAQMSAIEVPVTQIKGIPAMMGEVDVLKAIQLLPGVQSGNEGSAGVYVRGGGPDENLILLDGVPLYNVNHMMGFFSVFNADAVKNVTLYKGNFPARFGSRLSGVIDVRQNDGNEQTWHGNVTVGLIAAKANVEGPIKWKKGNPTTFNISARRTYFDLFSTPIMSLIARTHSDGRMALGAGYYFYDVNAKVSHRFSDNDKLSASFYMGDDVVYIRMKERESELAKMKMQMRWNWGNILAAVNYEHRYNARLYQTTQVSFTRYRYNLNQTLTQTDKSEQLFSLEEQMKYNSQIMDLMVQTNFDYSPSPKHDMKWGAAYTYHRFRPEIGSFRLLTSMGDSAAVDDSFNIDTIFTQGVIPAHEASVYFEDNYSPWRWLKLNLGLHCSLYNVEGVTYPSIEPRIGLRALILPQLAFKTSYAYMSQYVHLLSNSNISMPTDLWVPVTKRILPMRSMQVAAGFTYDVLGQVEISVEGYYKQQKNLIEYKDGATFYGSSTNWEDKVVMGDGWSYGVELLVQRKTGKLTGWIGYTWSRTMRRFDRKGQEINFGKPFHAKYDREHDLSITLQYAINKKMDIAGTFIFGTGTRATLATQIYYDEDKQAWVEYVSERNNYQMPYYHRLDLGMNFHLPHKKHPEYKSVISLNIYNVYNSLNPFIIYPDNFEGKLYKISLFPIMPSLSYTFKF